MKRQHHKSKSQNQNDGNFTQEVIITVLLSQERQILFKVQPDTMINNVKSLLFEKIKEIEQKEFIGFESIPSNYLFDYRFSKNIGVLDSQQNGNLTLKCLYKNSINGLDIQEKYLKIKNKSSSTWMHNLCKYKICKPLSSGGFSRVYLVRNLQNGQFYAAKFMDKSSQVNIDRQQAIRNQFYIHKSLDHPYIVKMQQYIQSQHFYILIMEYCPGGQLFTLLKNNRYMGEEKAKIIFTQVLLAIKYLHDRNIVFRDIKPQNILIDSKGNAKLTDFGLAKEIRGKTNSYCGSVEYMAPEIVSKHAYSFDVDLYCMGALLYEILIGCPPFYNPNFSNNQTKYHICNSEVCFPSKIPLSDEVKDLIGNLLIKNPNERLGHFQGVDEILRHQWIGQIQIQNFLKHRVKNPFVPHLDVENFDRQQDQYEHNFRRKILEDIKKIKRTINAKIMTKQRKKSHIKSKSQSFAILQRNNFKFKQQEQPNLKQSIDLFKIKTFSKKLISNKQNPYAFQIKNKSISQIYPISQDKKVQFINQIDGLKKKKQQRTLSRSLNKSSSSFFKNSNDPQNQGKIYHQNSTLTNTKSCENSRKSSLHKASSQGNFSKFANMTSYKYKLIHQQPNHPQIKSFNDSLKKKQQQKSKQKPFPKNHLSLLQKKEVYHTKQMKEKQNLENKGLKKNALKKKFLFSTAKQSGSGFIKSNHFKFEVVNCSEQKNIQNRLSAM